MTTIASVQGALPPHRYAQADITEAFASWLPSSRSQAVLRRVHGNARVHGRNLTLPLEDYADAGDFGEMNDEFLRTGARLATRALADALEDAGLRSDEVDLVLTTSVTGLGAPSLDARIAVGAGLRPDVKRIPVFGLGCVAGAAGIARLHDFLLGNPTGVAVLLSVELCSLTVQRDDTSTANLVASGLFGDGAACVVAVGAEHRLAGSGPRVVASTSHLYPDTERTMGWDVGASGLKIVLDAEVPTLVRRYLADDVRGLLEPHGLGVPDVAAWVCHPGGPKVIEAVQETLDLPPEALELTWSSLADVGNLSSASVLHVLRDTLRKRTLEPGSPGVLMAMGPGFCAELVLLRW